MRRFAFLSHDQARQVDSRFAGLFYSLARVGTYAKNTEKIFQEPRGYSKNDEKEILSLRIKKMVLGLLLSFVI